MAMTMAGRKISAPIEVAAELLAKSESGVTLLTTQVLLKLPASKRRPLMVTAVAAPAFRLPMDQTSVPLWL